MKKTFSSIDLRLFLSLREPKTIDKRVESWLYAGKEKKIRKDDKDNEKVFAHNLYPAPANISDWSHDGGQWDYYQYKPYKQTTADR